MLIFSYIEEKTKELNLESYLYEAVFFKRMPLEKRIVIVFEFLNIVERTGDKSLLNWNITKEVVTRIEKYKNYDQLHKYIYKKYNELVEK